LPTWVVYLLAWAAAWVLVIGGSELARAIYRRRVAAACPQCGGPAYRRSRQLVRYVCRGCGHAHDTGIREREID
jgi:hypothetical protein